KRRAKSFSLGRREQRRTKAFGAARILRAKRLSVPQRKFHKTTSPLPSLGFKPSRTGQDMRLRDLQSIDEEPDYIHDDDGLRAYEIERRQPAIAPGHPDWTSTIYFDE